MGWKKWSRKKKFFIITLSFILLLALLVLAKIQIWNIPASCGDSQIVFSQSPIDPDKLLEIIPLGNLNPPGHTFPVEHMYWNLHGEKGPNGRVVAEEAVDVVAPADIWIPLMGSMEYSDEDYFDYNLVYIPCRGLISGFTHLDQISTKIKDGFKKGLGFCVPTSPGGRNIKLCLKLTGITVKAGEKVGVIGSHVKSNGIDIGLSDYRIEVPYMSKLGYKRNWSDRRAVCPLDYFPDDIKKDLYSLLGGNDKKRVVEPLCGVVHQDIKSTAQGNWYFNGTDKGDDKEENGVALVHDNIDPTIPVISSGFKLQEIGVETKVHFVDDVKSQGFVNRDFSEVKADGNIYCYQIGNREKGFYSILVKLENENLLKIGNNGDQLCGQGPWKFADSVTFKR